jgi:ribosome-binding protein aMBF1 (putative translation factor)
MAFSDEVFPPDDQCEICGARLDDEIVIQEFADGSLARLCNECAAGAALGTEEHLGHGLPQPEPENRALADADPLERTRELLTPVVDLIGLQREMQAALERLAASLETFAAGVLIENQDKTATVEDRVQSLEHELELTRARLQEAEALLAGAAVAPAPAQTGTATGATVAGMTAAAALAPRAVGTASGLETSPAAPAAETLPPAEAEPAAEAALVAAAAAVASATTALPAPEPEVAPPALFTEGAESTWPGAPAAAVAAAASAVGDATQAPAAAQVETPRHGFRIEEVQAAQRYFNESLFTGKTRDVQSSLGRPRANLTRAVGTEPRAFVTITWDIVWYQYLVDMRPDVPSDQRVVLHREGMDLDELAHYFKEKNATIDDNGRLDASELEVKLLSDPSALITEMTVDEEKALEDATEEIWDQHISPEFNWDD